MINLLPEPLKNDIKAARSNSILVKYIIVMTFGAVFLALVSYGTYLILSGLKTSADSLIHDNTTKTASYVEITNQIKVADDTLSSASNIINQEVKYSKILTGLASIMPAGTIIDNIVIDQNAFNTKSTITFYATNADTAATLKSALEQSTPGGLFSSVTFQSLSGSNKSSINGYNNILTVDVIFNREFAS